MIEIFILLVYILPLVYCVFMLIRISWLYHRRKISAVLIGVELVVTGIFLLYHYYLLPEREIFIFGETKTNTKDYGEGIANLAVWAINYLISLGIYLLIQILFWIRVSKSARRKRKIIQAKDAITEIGIDAGNE